MPRDTSTSMLAPPRLMAFHAPWGGEGAGRGGCGQAGLRGGQQGGEVMMIVRR